jgi:hypothetical protein
MHGAAVASRMAVSDVTNAMERQNEKGEVGVVGWGVDMRALSNRQGLVRGRGGGRVQGMGQHIGKIPRGDVGLR